MRKISLMLVSLFCTLFAAQAQTLVTDLSQLSNDKVYTLKSERAFLLYSDKVPGEICSSNGNSVGSVSYSLEDVNLQFRIEKNGNNYYLFSEGAQKYVGANGAFTDKASAALSLTKTTNATYPWLLVVGGQGLNSQIKGQTASGIIVNSWTAEDAGNRYQLAEAVAKAKVYSLTVLGGEGSVTFEGEQYQNGATIETNKPLKSSHFTATPVDGKIAIISIDGLSIYLSYMDAATTFYTMRGGHGGYVSVASGYTDGGNLLLTNTNVPKDNKGLWAFEKQDDGGYKIYNYSTGLSKVLGMTGSEDGARATMVAPDATTHTTTFDGNIKFDGTDGRIKLKGSANNYWNKRGNYLALWNSSAATSNDTGSMFYLDEADYVSYPDEYIHEITDIKGIDTFKPENPNTLWYKTSAEAAGVSYPWMEYALPLGNGELGCMVFGGVAHEELQFNEKTLWSGPANTVGAGGGNRTFMNRSS